MARRAQRSITVTLSFAAIAALGACARDQIAVGGGSNQQSTPSNACAGKACGADCTPSGSEEPSSCNMAGECVAARSALGCTSSSPVGVDSGGPVKDCSSPVKEGDACADEGLQCAQAPETWVFCTCSDGQFDCNGNINPICKDGVVDISGCPDDRLVILGETCTPAVVVCSGALPPDGVGYTRTATCKDGKFETDPLCPSN